MTVFDLKFASMNYLLTIFELVHTCILLKTYFRHKLRNSDWNTDENFLLENDNKAISRTVSNGSMRSKNCFVHQKPSTFVQKSTIESVHVCNMPVCLSMDFLIYERNCYIWDSHMSRTFWHKNSLNICKTLSMTKVRAWPIFTLSVS